MSAVPEGYVTTVDIQKRVGSLTRSRIYDDVKSGRITAYKIPANGKSGRLLFKPEDVEAYCIYRLSPQAVVPASDTT